MAGGMIPSSCLHWNRTRHVRHLNCAIVCSKNTTQIRDRFGFACHASTAVTILYIVRATTASQQHAHGLWSGPRWLGNSGQMGTAAGLGRTGAVAEPKDDASGATGNHRHYDSCQSAGRRRHCLSNPLWTAREEITMIANKFQKL